MLTANSDKKAIPVIFINNDKKVLFIDVLLVSDCSKLIIPVNLSITNKIIKAPANRLIKIVYSGLYCFNKTIIIKATKAIPIIFITSIVPPMDL